MPRVPFKLLVLVGVGSYLWIHLAPKRAEQAMGIFRRKRNASSEETARILIQDKIRSEICAVADLSEYRPHSWVRFQRPDSATTQLEHQFFCDAVLRRYLFRVRNGAVAEVIDLR